jgi:hypothetical protein
MYAAAAAAAALCRCAQTQTDQELPTHVSFALYDQTVNEDKMSKTKHILSY